MLINNRYFTVFRTAARGLEAQRIALAAATENIANASTTRTADGSPYAIKRATHEVADPQLRRFGPMLKQMQLDLDTTDERHLSGTTLRRRMPDLELGPSTKIQETVQTRLEYDPAHPHANAEGYVEYPDINIVEEMARMISANRIYEANLSAVQSAKDIIKRTLDI